MRTLLDIQKRLLPDLLEVMQKRYQILQSIRMAQPVGRRTLAQELGLTERILRSEVEFLKEQELIEFKTSGMILTPDGQSVLVNLEELMIDIKGIHTMESQLKSYFSLDEVVVVPGDSDQSPWVKKELGTACANSIKSRLLAKNIIAVTGGTTIAAAASAMSSELARSKELVFVPARGGIGEDVQNQANTIVAQMAANTGGTHRVLYAPDQIRSEAYDSFMMEPAIKEVYGTIQSATMVLHGIGDALTMANRRHTTKEDMDTIVNGKAVAEAFGYYFDENGKIVHKVSTIGLQLDDLVHVKDVIAVAGGASKSKAIHSYLQGAPKATVLITDEAAAKQLIEEMNR
ncbi:central glycolytic genes regulator [Bacillus ectoiniformans]|uniref:sugar-binding transcriptional regulator n=1 Tax=Bacillus ectoiniformans TaxID=1494429 RepID=UPI001959791D|nr:sugar-binding domain-containing protein [Bacillus ectoiniformans]MBM7648740.1 central glycolytic genes regulator [Bacillus ectoiniformans]